jgi:excisionase family DNA binding protein
MSQQHQAAPAEAPDGAPFHPLANLFPLLDQGEINDLAADLEQNGQRHEIVWLDGVAPKAAAAAPTVPTSAAARRGGRLGGDADAPSPPRRPTMTPTATETEAPYVTPTVAARTLLVAVRTVLRLLERGELKGRRIGKLWQVSRDDLSRVSRDGTGPRPSP